MGTANLFLTFIKSAQNLFPARPSLKKPLHAIENSKANTRKPITVGNILSSIKPIPFNNIMFGVCKDGLPLLMTLGEPEIGSILIGCDAGCGKTHQVQVMVDSAFADSAPHQRQLAILTLYPEEWINIRLDQNRSRYLRGIHAWYDHKAESLIREITELAEARREGRRKGPSVFFVLDDLHFVEDLSYEAQVNLRWLLEYGSQSDIWLIGTINAEQTTGFRFWIDTFRTRIIGKVQSQANAMTLAMASGLAADCLAPGEFSVFTGENWLQYQIPMLGD